MERRSVWLPARLAEASDGKVGLKATMRQRRLVCAVLFGVALACLAGCGGGGGTTSATTADVATASTVVAPTTPPPVTTAAPSPAAALVPNTAIAGWNLVWSDEFNTDGLPDTNKWDYDTDRNRLGWYNGELQYYARSRLENAKVEGGSLVITARRENLSTAADYGGQNYTSARLVTRGKASWTYGFVEVRAKLPCGGGTWPAIWTLGTGGRWPEDGEIDLMEQTGANKGQVLGTIHTRAYNYSNGSLGVGQGSSRNVSDACTAFHKYQLTWDANAIVIGVDGTNYFTYTKSVGANTDRWPFDNPQYLLLNLAVGGSLGGTVDNASFPNRMEVDYVRVYQR
jgi:beta-glucanase (GH16 family)